MSRVSSLDIGYQAGDLSLFPNVIDDKDQLYEAKNNASTILTQTLTINGKYIIVEDASSFPESGLLRIGPLPGTAGNAELIYYGERTNTVFKELQRAFAGSIAQKWEKDSFVSNAVMAEHHNAVKDAIINIESYLGLKNNPTSGSLNYILKNLENKFLAPKAVFRAYPKKIKPGDKVKFQNFSEGNVIRNFWDFGDGTTSIEENPTHIYSSEGNYSVSLNIITSTGAQGIYDKKDYINVSEDNNIRFFYVVKKTGYEYQFVDQTEGNITQRFWVFGDGTSEFIDDPDIHTITHTYTPGTYHPSLIIVGDNATLKRMFLTEELVVT